MNFQLKEQNTHNQICIMLLLYVIFYPPPKFIGG